MTVPYLLRFCPCRALMYVVWYSYPGCRFACPGLCACWAFSPCIIGCTSAIQASLIAFGLCDNSARPCLNQKLILSHGCVESQSTRPEGTEVHSPAASEATPWAKEIIGLSARLVCLLTHLGLCATLAFSPLRLPLLHFVRAVRGDRRDGYPSWRVGCPFAVRARHRA